ncbi:MAG: polyprenyl synthetase family protein [Bacteroidetes bacterium]|nr:polyprenyl synthetase family protein [Bacteroidota bacterium]NCQ10907.1 polyprenyl synthetase family protein [Bacteroidota bacterium]
MDFYLAELEKELIGHRIPNEPVSIYDPVRYTLSLGGKRIRPVLCYLACGMTGGAINLAKDAAIAVEMLHNFTLIHDDIMDNAETRRGKPSVFKKWDSNTAILSGDVLFTLALEQLAFYQTKPFPSPIYPALMNEFLKATRIVCDGQALDMEFEKRTDVSLDQYLLMISQKTARLLSCSLKMGGLIGEGSPEQIQALYQIGFLAGIAFQIQDDLLDAFGDPNKFGKKVGGDIREGKKTFLSISALNKASEFQKDRIQAVLDKKSASDEEIEEILSIYTSLNIHIDTVQTVNEYYISAMKELAIFPNSPFKKSLITFLDQLNTRLF